MVYLIINPVYDNGSGKQFMLWLPNDHGGTMFMLQFENAIRLIR